MTETAAPIPIQTLSLTEIDNVHGWMATLFRSFGIQGHELDVAISESFRTAFQAIDRHRLAKQETKEWRAGLRIVGGTECDGQE